ncbi:hypothetical protein CBM2623_A50002 [Cupriavidus taiwanensis]|nr:hypothetical protein CBM2623_A50002 [Cupriavidus taiwanensis]
MPFSAASCRIDGSRAPGRASRLPIHAFTPSTICSVSGIPVEASKMSFMGDTAGEWRGQATVRKNY